MTRTLAISEVSARSPDMDPASFAVMVNSIRTNGQLAPIVLSGADIIDGRKRYAACQQLGIEPKTVDIDPSQDPESVAIALNVVRTHYTASQRAMFAAGRANATKGDRRSDRDIHKNMDVKTVGQVADEVGVHRTYVDTAKKILRRAAPEVVAAVKSGDLTLHAAEQITMTVPVEEQPAVVQKVVTASFGNRRSSPTASVLGKDTGIGRFRRPLPPVGVIENLVDRFEDQIELMEQQIDRATADVRYAEFITRLRDVRRRISAALAAMENIK